MSERFRNVFTHSAAWAAEVVDETPTGPASSPLMPADRQNVGWAGVHWPESNADEFEWGLGGMRVRHRATGEVFKIRLGSPAGGELQSDIQTWCVRDRRLILLARPGSERPSITSIGTISSTQVLSGPSRPADGDTIW